MALLRKNIESLSRASAWESVAIALSRARLHTADLQNLKKILGARRYDQAMGHAVLVAATACMNTDAPILDQIRPDRLEESKWVGSLRSKKKGRSSKTTLHISVPRWQLFVILSSLSEGTDSPEAFANQVVRRSIEALKPAFMAT